MPSINIIPATIAIKRRSLIRLSSGTFCKARYNKPDNNNSEIIPPRIPFQMLLSMNGLRIKPFVAPTRIMLLISNRLEYKEIRIVLFIKATETKINKTENVKRMSVIALRFLLILSTKDA